MQEPDLNAPRFRETYVEVLDRFKINEFLDKYKNVHPEMASYDILKVRNIIRTFNKNLYNLVIDTREGVELPNNIGCIFITVVKPKKNFINYKESIGKKKPIYFTNNKTDGYLADVVFSTKDNRYHFKNHEIWQFNTARDFKRDLCKRFPLTWNNYRVKGQEKDQWNAYLNSHKANRAKKYIKSQLEQYNELEI